MMELSKILSISGKPGLYRMLAQTKTGMVVEGLADNKRFTAFSHQRIGSLEEISVYTTGDDMPLRDILKKAFTFMEGKPIDNIEDGEELRLVFGQIVPEFDQERVYNSDIRKIFNWYNILLEHTPDIFTQEPEEETKEDVSAEIAETT
jgi:hypothetical protein